MSGEELEQVKKEFARLRKSYAPLDDDIDDIDKELRSRRKKR